MQATPTFKTETLRIVSNVQLFKRLLPQNEQQIQHCSFLTVTIVRSRLLCSWGGLNEAIQDQSVSTHVFYVTILIMHNMHAHLLTLAKMATLPRLVQNCFKERNTLLER